MQVMKHRFLRLCSVMVASVGLVPAMSAVAVADPGADLSVTATWVGKGVPRGAVGERVTYAITLTNLGPDTATGASFFATLPDQFNPVSLTCSDDAFCSESGGLLAPGATTTATVVDVVCCFPKGDSRTTSAGAGVTSSDDPNIANDTASVVTRIIGPHGFFLP
jgi:uncharacterized repeat protein (TIGR01451 family)